jgi:RNA-directed DNA polymerase
MPELTDKLDAARAAAFVVSGPEDAVLGWELIDWRTVEHNVRRMRQRIFTATKAGTSDGSAGCRG